MKKFTFIFILLLLSVFSFSQDTLKVKKERKQVEFGPKNTHYYYAFLNFMFPTIPDNGNDAEIFYGKSHSVSYGIRYRIKLSSFFAIGTGLNYTYYVWHFKQTDNKKIPTSNIYDKEKLKINALEADVFFRIKISNNKKSPVGNFVDIGIHEDYGFSTKRQFKNYLNIPGTEGFATYTGENSDLNYLNKFNFGAELRIGFGSVVLFGKYRLSDMFTKDFKKFVSPTELQRLSIGFELGLHK